MRAKCQELRRCRNGTGGVTKGGQCPWSQVRLCGGGRASLGYRPRLGSYTVIALEGAEQALLVDWHWSLIPRDLGPHRCLLCTCSLGSAMLGVRFPRSSAY